MALPDSYYAAVSRKRALEAARAGVKRVRLTAEQRAAGIAAHETYCKRVWEQADSALRAQLQASDWFVLPREGEQR